MTNSAILTYHSIDTSGSVISTSPAVFRRHLEIIAEQRVQVVPLSKIRQVSNALAITFDDGFGNFEDCALGLLRENRFPATVFVVSGYCGSDNGWPSQPASIPRMPLMSWETMRRIGGADLEWGAHTVSHPDLVALSEGDAMDEIRGCRDSIQQKTGSAVKLFAYPYGTTNAAVRSRVAKEFDLACGTRLDFLGSQDDPWELPRIDTYYLRDPIWLQRLLTPTGATYVGIRRMLRNARSWLSR